FHAQLVAVCRELTKGPIVSALRTDDCLVLFPGNPLPVAKYHAALPPSRAKDAPTDAARQVESLLTHRDQLPTLHPPSPTTRAVAQLVAHRQPRVGDNVRLPHRLTRALTHSLPQVRPWFPDTETAILCDVLSRWPTRKAAQLARRTTLVGFCHAHHVRAAAVMT